MNGIGTGELVVILVVALVVFGPRKLPELGRSLGQAMREFKRVGHEIMREFTGNGGEGKANPGPDEPPPSDRD